jgi:hypothetical protein
MLEIMMNGLEENGSFLSGAHYFSAAVSPAEV